MIEKLKVKKAQVGPFQKSKSQFCFCQRDRHVVVPSRRETRAATHNPRSHLACCALVQLSPGPSAVPHIQHAYPFAIYTRASRKFPSPFLTGQSLLEMV